MITQFGLVATVILLAQGLPLSTECRHAMSAVAAARFGFAFGAHAHHEVPLGKGWRDDNANPLCDLRRGMAR